MSMGACIAVVWDVLKMGFSPIKRGFGYVMSSKSYADNLRQEVRKLDEEVGRVGHIAEEAGNNCRDLNPSFMRWEDDAKRNSRDAHRLLDAFDGATKTCCYGRLPDPKCRYQFSTNAEAQIKVVRELAQQCIDQFTELNDISSIGPAPGKVIVPNSAGRAQSPTGTASVFSASTSIKLSEDGLFESRTSVIQKVMDALANTSNSVVGIYGMGGVGKSTLLVDIEKRIRKENSFDWVAKADVSENPDIKTIQGEIARALDLTDMKNQEYPTARAELLHKRLEKDEREKKKVLIVLDNLWERLDLDRVGIPCGLDNKARGCKLLLTARDQRVLRREMRCDNAFPLGVLNEEEAKGLFEKMVGGKVEVELEPLMEEALRICAGLPFLIVAISKLFIDTAYSECEYALKQIWNEDTGKVITNMLQLSYGRISEEAKSLLRLCVAYGVSKPSLEYLARYSFGLGMFRGVSGMQEIRVRLSSLIHTLRASSLLLDGEEDADASSLLLDGEEDADVFKIHDLVREFIASFASTGHPLLVLKDKDKWETTLSEDKLKSCEAICFPYVGLKQLSKKLNCPELQIFLLFENNKSFEISDSYFNSMKNLKALHLTGIHLSRSPSPFQFLENLHSLSLDYCSIEDVSILGELKGLQILSLQNSDIQRLPKEIGQLVELILLDLSHCSQLETIEPYVLGSLTKLEELYMLGSFDRWSAREQTPPTKASLIELNNMKKLHTLHVPILDPSVLPKDLDVEKLTTYMIQIGNVSFWSEYSGSRTLELKMGPTSDVLRRECIQSILDKTDKLSLEELNKTERSICVFSRKGFPQLKHLQVCNCASIHYILERSSLPAFKALETLLLENLVNLEKICHNHISTESFRTLKVVRVESCIKMEVLFPLSVLRELPQLEEIKVVSCELMRGIVEVDDDRGKFELPKLRVLKLRDLPNIENFFATKSAPSSSSSNNRVGTQIAFFNGQQVAFPRLETLNITSLNNFGFVFFSSTVKSLAQLKELSIWYCNDMETIIVEEEGLGMDTSENMAFPMLTNLSLLDLPRLKCFSRRKCTGEAQSQDHVESYSTAFFNREVDFPKLKTLNVKRLGNLGFIFYPPVVKSFAQLRELSVSNCANVEAIIAEEEGLGMEASKTLAFPMLIELHLTNLGSLSCFSRGKCTREDRSHGHIQSRSSVLFNRKVAFPNLETLCIDGMDNIEMIWGNQLAEDSFHNLKSISVSRCERITSLFPISIASALMQLEKLEIHDCGIAELIEKEEGLVPRFVFPNLTSLELKHLTELKCLYTGTHTSHWPTLKTLEVDGCDKVEILASQFEKEMPRHKQPLFLIEKGAFPSLQELKLDLCERMEIWHGDFHGEEFFCKLRVLELRHSAKESATSTSHFVESLTNLEELVLREFYLTEPSGNVEVIEGPSQEQKLILPFSRQIKHLKALNVSDYDGLSSMFTQTMAKNLAALTKLRISNCRILTEVISDKGDKEGREVAFHHLKCLELDGLTELRCFSSGGCALIFPILEDVIVNGCPNMNFFSEGPIEAPKLERVKVDVTEKYGSTKYQYFWKENLNVTIQNMFEEVATIAKAEFVRLFEIPELIGKWHNEHNPVNSSWQLKTMVVDKCPSFINAIPSKMMLVLEKMKSLKVRDCKSLEEIFDLEGLEPMQRILVLPCLEHLDLINLPKLRQLWKKDLQGTMRFNSLFSLTLYKCSNLRHAFTPSMAFCLANLYRMEIGECLQMEGVIEEEEGQGSAVKKITFPRLSQMILKHLPNLTSFLSGKNHALDCPKLQYLRIAHCPKLRSLTWESSMDIDHSTPSLFTPRVQFLGLVELLLSHVDNLSKIWTDNPLETLTFGSLMKVKAKNCERLENLFPHWVATSLTQLDKLRVESCRIEEIVANGDDTPHSNIAQVLFPKLTSLVLHDMPRLKTFCPNLPTLKWPFLEELRVSHCDKVNMLSFTASINKWTQRNDQQNLLDQEAHSSFERDFPKLEKLLLDAKDIQMLWDGKYPDDIFGKLKGLTLACFQEENAIFPPKFLLERFQNLKSLEVFYSSFEDIFPDEGFVDEGKHPVLESLRELKLSKLHKLRRVWREDYLVSKILQSIKTLEIWDCPSLTILFPAATSFQNLRELVVKNSSGLVHLGTASAIASLVHLEEMTIVRCEKMKEVVANDENGGGQVISFGKLWKLKLQNMASLDCFSSTTSCVLRFPSLLIIEVEECPKMKMFSKGTLSTPGLRWGTLFGYRWERIREWEGDLNRAMKNLSA